MNTNEAQQLLAMGDNAPRWALYAYKLDENGEIEDDDQLFVFENYAAAEATLLKMIKENTTDNVYFDLETGTIASFEEEEEGDAPE